MPKATQLVRGSGRLKPMLQDTPSQDCLQGASPSQGLGMGGEVGGREYKKQAGSGGGGVGPLALGFGETFLPWFGGLLGLGSLAETGSCPVAGFRPFPRAQAVPLLSTKGQHHPSIPPSSLKPSQGKLAEGSGQPTEGGDCSPGQHKVCSFGMHEGPVPSLWWSGGGAG